MTRISSAPSALVALTLASVPAEALATTEAFGLPERFPAQNLASLRVGMEPVPLVELGYVQPELLRVAGEALGAGVAFGAPLLLIPGFRDFRLSAGLSASFALGGDFRLANGVSTFWATANDGTARSDALGLEAGTSPRYCRPLWYIGLPLKLRSTALLHLAHSNYMKLAYDDRYDNGATNTPSGGERIEGPYDGWYALTGWRLFAGLEAGVTAASFAFHFGAGTFWAPQAQGLFFSPETGQIPLYLEIDVRFAF